MLLLHDMQSCGVTVLLDDSFLGRHYLVSAIDEISEKARNHVLDRSRRLENHQ